MTLDAQQALGHLPQGLRDELMRAYDEIVRNYREGRWKASGAGRRVVLRDRLHDP